MSLALDIVRQMLPGIPVVVDKFHVVRGFK